MKFAQLLTAILLLGLIGYIGAEYALPMLYKWATQTPDTQTPNNNASQRALVQRSPTVQNVPEETTTPAQSAAAEPANAPTAMVTQNLLAGIELPESAEWVDYANQYDKTRLGDYLLAIRTGNVEAYEAEQADNAALTALLNAEHQPLNVDELLGKWRCRTTKVGGVSNSITTYSYFTCRFVQQDGHLFFEKISGSQRTSGFVYANTPQSMVYLGASTVNNDPQQPYSGADNLLGKDPDNLDTPAILVQLAADHLLLLFPYPARESVYDILELRR